MKSIFAIGLIILLGFSAFSQESKFSPLFSKDTPLNIRLDVSIKEVRKETNDTTYMEGVMRYENETGTWDSIDIKIRTRGDFRLKECFFPPLRIKIKKKDAKGTLFEGNKALKLVMPCKKGGDNNELVVKEFLCYKLYESITPYTFSTRLINLDFWDRTGKKHKNYKLTTFFIEDDDIVADRYNGIIKEGLNLHPLALHDTSAIRHDFFQYMIANIDWSTTYMHNAKLMLTEDPLRYIPLTYDFDMSGFVNAPYAMVNPEFDMAHIRDRIYRGFCRNSDYVLYHVRDHFISQEQTIFNTISEYQDQLAEKDYKSLVKFVEDFYETFKNEKSFKLEILDRCRNE